MLTRRIGVPARYDLTGTVRPLVLGRYDPTCHLAPGEFWRAARTPDGPGTVRLVQSGGVVTATGYGDGGGWLVDRAHALAGLHDDAGPFAEIAARHPVVARLAREHPGLRIPRSGLVFQELVPTILGQKVTGRESVRSFGRLIRHFGEPAPGPGVLVLPPDPAAVAATPYWVFHPWGVERRRADTLRRAAAHARRLEETVDMAPADAHRRLRAVPGIGPWTVGELGRLCFGDPDAVSPGDYHHPHMVSWALSGEPRADDARMLELLAPFAGHRARVMRLLLAGGPYPPRRGPRMPLRDIARI